MCIRDRSRTGQIRFQKFSLYSRTKQKNSSAMIYAQSLATLSFIILSLAVIKAQRTNDTDRISPLPGWPTNVPFQIFSGLLDLDGKGKNIHYVLLTSQNKLETDPLILWLNGGPGCSSLIGMLQEIGPFILPEGESSTFKANNYSWNNNANLLFFEAPPGVGFSSGNPEELLDDSLTAKYSLQALKLFYQLFPGLVPNDFYIAGESYGGIYIPYLAREIVKSNTVATKDIINLKGTIVGNGLVITDESFLTTKLMDYFWNHQFYGYEVREVYDTACPKYPSSPRCLFAISTVLETVDGINPMNIYKPCPHNKADNHQTTDYAPWYTSLVKKLSLQPNNTHLAQSSVKCFDTSLEKYLNKEEVKNALRVPLDIHWTLCKQGIRYKGEDVGSLGIYKELLDANLNLKFLVYFGDSDAVVNFNQAFGWLEMLGLEEKEMWRQWRVDNQVAGYVTGYEKNFYFATVRAGGHTAPADKPKEVNELVFRFIHGTPIQYACPVYVIRNSLLVLPFK
eukprot:TRINITY_DN10747_c0_g1_i2.p1 TRINITY_DN10747_c0_g1~~TRINITY_DN10747_c0_g1_i2.p1  ORF type:complete len:530 (+),score=85.21 TRINITY_DN10747_c0_g1_i2:64-1590(+)